MKKIFSVFLLIFLFQPQLHAEDFLAKRTAKLGQAAPDFELQDLSGNTVKLSALQGSPVMIHFWSATCPFVVRYEDRLRDLALEYGPKGVVVAGIDSNINETPDQIKKTAEDRKLAYPVLLDPEHKTADDYGAITTPHVFIIDKEGKLAYEGAVDDQGWSEEKAVTKNYARNALDAVLAGLPVAEPETKTAGCTVKRKK